MRKALAVALLVGGMLAFLPACSARTQFFLEETRKNGAHFSTWHHMGYSLRRATPEDTTKTDLQAAQQEKWWGEVIVVEPIL